MPQTPVLTKKQQKLSLSAKKTKSKETIRNVLATPYEKYWPLITAEQCELLHDTLSKVLPRILPEKIQIPWKLLCVPKSERKTIRQEYLKKHSLENTCTGSREGLVFGVNDVTKTLEKGVIKSLLITEDVRPKLMVEHLLDISVLFRIPVLIVPKLRSVLKATCGFSSVVIAFTDSTRFELIQQLIENIHKEYPVPKNHINFKRSLDLMNISVISIEDSVIENQEADVSSKTIDGISIDESVISISDTDKSVIESGSQDIYLYRQSKRKRIFIPNKSDNLENNDQKTLDSHGFLPCINTELQQVNQKTLDSLRFLSCTQTEPQQVVSFCLDTESSNPKTYKSLKVKKIKGNVNRNKRKIEDMKSRQVKKYQKKIKKRQK